MKKVFLILGVVALLASCGKQTVDKNPTLTSDLDSASYSFGVLIGSDIKKNSLENEVLNHDLIHSGLVVGLEEDTTAKITRDEAIRIWNGYLAKQNEKKREKAKQDLEENKDKGVKFLEENKEKAGVITTESGLQYQVIEQGEGKVPQKGDTVKVNYKGTLIDGTVFDTTENEGRAPFEFVVGEGRVIKGWDEALQLMPVGSKWKLFIPSELAYGDREIPKIKGGSTLVFDVELLEIK
ncbi:FKBP-type peptidyl-prolyl cis-trans isomerase FkpA/FKBP-type peptidyl-prolyl cis-trans isomerase FklB [Balneicella halophila]|uniref:Peptidyl-prolyl cis-trans isomerase n=1 Tax=Balneicella halophila TaxID=1537566 RepID=A0A7L4UPF9_BALHA|nr:FKBP-type peptidyl-prolyl cis-trans isomerase [Balneicella halophila]PVX50998.1 FKBP-type peptidyl-prolyl cis-trans isomerase FkpA/FKBP-type peptidyl-prolyl cis-trans isomerase FklB [Balneicella halophila]